MSTVVDDVDSWRKAWYVIASSVATSWCFVVDTVACDLRRRTSSLFVDVVRRCWQASSSSVGTVRWRRQSLPWPWSLHQFHCWRRLPGFRLVILFVSFTMANPSLGDTYSTLHQVLLCCPSLLVICLLGLMPRQPPPWLSLVWS